MHYIKTDAAGRITACAAAGFHCGENEIAVTVEKVSFTGRITKYTAMPKKMVENLADYLDKEYGIDADSVKRGCMITFDYTAKGKAMVETDKNIGATMLNIDGKWYRVYVSSTTKDDKKIMTCEFYLPDFIDEYIWENVDD